MKNKNLLYLSFALIIVMAVLDRIARFFYLYWTVGWFDTFVHFVGGVAIGFFVLWIYFRFFSRSLRLNRWLILFVSLIPVMVIGIGWEFFEFAYNMTQATEETYFLDVTHDLLADAFGATLAALLLMRKK